MLSTFRRSVAVPVTVLLLSLAACQGANTTSPATSPKGSAAPESPALAPTVIPESTLEADLTPGQGMFGLNTLSIDLATMSAELEPVRMATAIGDSYDVDIYEYLRQSPCGDCLQVQGLGYTGTEVEVQLAAKHPFTFGPKRYDLHVFDVRGTLIPLGGTATNAGLLSDMAGANTPISGQLGVLANAEGYSSLFTEQVKPYLGSINPPPAGTIFPFKTFFRDLAPTNYDSGGGTFSNLQFPEGHNTMAMGEDFEPGGVKYRINVGASQQMQFLFLLDAAYGASSTRQTRLAPKYFLPEFHRKDPFEVTLEISGAQLVAPRSNDIAQATVTVRDWQGDIPANPSFSPDAAASTLKAVSSVEELEFMVQGVMSTPSTALRGVDFTGTVLPGEYWTTYEHTFSFTNALLADEGIYYAVVAARDALYGSGEPIPAQVVTREFTNGQPPQVLTDITTYAVAAVEVFPLPIDCPGAMGPTFNPTVLVAPPSDGTFNQGKNWDFNLTNIALSGTSLATALDRIEIDQDWDNNPFNFSANGFVPLTGTGPTIGTISTDFSAIAPLTGVNPSHRVGFRVVDNLGNCNYTSAIIALWPPVTCPGTRGPAFTYAATNAPQAQGNNTTFQISNMTRGGQTAIASIEMTFPGFPSVPAKNIPVPGGAEPYNFSVNENFSDPGFGVFAVTTNVQTVITAEDVEGNCSTQTVSLDVNIGVPAPSFDLIQNPFPAEPIHHGQTVQFLIDNILTPSSTIQDVMVDVKYNGTSFVQTVAATVVMLDANTYQASYDWRNTAYLPTSTQLGTISFAARVRNTSGKETILTEPISFTDNVAPNISWQASAPTTTAAGVSISILASHVSATDTDGSISSYRISWGDATADYTGTLAVAATHTYAAAGNYTMTVYARDNGYGPTNGPAPLPTSREGTGATRTMTVTGCAACAGVTPTPFWCEDFECTSIAVNSIPTGWVLGTGVSNGSRFGVKRGSGLGTLAGNTSVLEESGSTGAATVDTAFSNNGGSGNAARWGVWSPPITLPATGTLTLETVHRVNYSYASSGVSGNVSGEGAKIYIKAGATDPGTTETGAIWLNPTAGGTNVTIPATPYSSAFCTNLINGNGLSATPALPSPNPVWGQITAAVPGWFTTTMNLTPYAGQTIRIYFVHSQCRWTTSLFCAPAAWNPDGVNGWRIDRVRITQS